MLTFGIVGTNFISEWFADACRATNGQAAAIAVCSRDLDRAKQFAAKIGADLAFDDLGAMIDAVDAVYIASPIAAHFPQAMQAIESGKHVLIEKTMGATAGEVAEILAAAQAKGVIAMEAVRNVHTPSHQLIRDTLPRLGTLRHAHIEKLQYSSRYDRFRAGEQLNAFDPGLGNSALADIGVYCLQPALDLFGVPKSSSGSSIWLHNGFEAGGSLQLGYGTAVAEVAYSKIATGQGPSAIHGEDGSVTFNDPAELAQITFLPRGGDPQTLLALDSVEPGDTMSHEVIDFVDQVETGVMDPRWADLSLLSRELMDEHLARRPTDG